MVSVVGGVCQVGSNLASSSVDHQIAKDKMRVVFERAKMIGKDSIRLKGDSRAPLPSFDPGEFHTVRWFSFSEIPYSQSEPHILRFINKLQR